MYVQIEELLGITTSPLAVLDEYRHTIELNRCIGIFVRRVVIGVLIVVHTVFLRVTADVAYRSRVDTGGDVDSITLVGLRIDHAAVVHLLGEDGYR